MEMALFGMGCFWGAEKGFWLLPGVHSTSVGYAGGFKPNASYEEVCSGRTGHVEVVRVVFDPKVTSYAAMLKQFWEGHDPTQGMRQGGDIGTQYRSAIYYYSDDQRREAEASKSSVELSVKPRQRFARAVASGRPERVAIASYATVNGRASDARPTLTSAST